MTFLLSSFLLLFFRLVLCQLRRLFSAYANSRYSLFLSQTWPLVPNGQLHRLDRSRDCSSRFLTLSVGASGCGSTRRIHSCSLHFVLVFFKVYINVFSFFFSGNRIEGFIGYFDTLLRSFFSILIFKIFFYFTSTIVFFFLVVDKIYNEKNENEMKIFWDKIFWFFFCKIYRYIYFFLLWILFFFHLFIISIIKGDMIKYFILI